jgi:hypothetical protein
MDEVWYVAGGLDAWKVDLGVDVASVTRTAFSVTAGRETMPDKSQAAAIAKDSPSKRVREMTRARHFGVPSTSYAEHPFLKKSSLAGHLPRNDVPSNNF